MTVFDHSTRRPLWDVTGGTRCIPDDVVACPRCGGAIYYVEVLADTLDEQARTWLCVECAGTGTITLTITVRQNHSAPTPKPVVIEHRQSRARVAA